MKIKVREGEAHLDFQESATTAATIKISLDTEGTGSLVFSTLSWWVVRTAHGSKLASIYECVLGLLGSVRAVHHRAKIGMQLFQSDLEELDHFNSTELHLKDWVAT